MTKASVVVTAVWPRGDGKLDFADLLSLAQHYNGAAAAWTKGDFNYDGEVTFIDLLALAKRW